MIKDALSVLNWKRNIRGKMFWSAFLSFTAAVYLTSLLGNDLGIITNPFGSYAVMIVSFFLLFYILTRPVVRQLKRLADGLMFLAGGNLDYRVPLSSQDELGKVAQNINYMAEQLQEMMEKERRIEMSKMELITSVSHDLRTPLTSIIGYLNLLKNDDYQDLDEHKRYIGNAFNKTQQLKKLIDDLFEYTRLTSGAEQLDLRTVDLSGLLEQIIAEFEPIAQEHSLTVRTDLGQGRVFGSVDVEKFVRAVDNLLVNALKFSVQTGDIAVRLAEREEHIRLEVENRGKPITKEQEQLLFERFYKAEPSRSDNRMPPGGGLGLSIAKNIVELHGGRIGLHHHEGLFVFYIELPRT
ncbi:HAMP domain-containing sensor histidine kinase [Paenibacillus hamazuiensis]|uniref:HAMP domain-containing sensor histidine kinase n=1 Tax=Paenibacillus hamazuiensis TaxID=2936508 RepID=UPI00200C134F|nr:HAMP domain-containing sensor histidine kinase [Paenibacillus hamazuiensis]